MSTLRDENNRLRAVLREIAADARAQRAYLLRRAFRAEHRARTLELLVARLFERHVRKDGQIEYRPKKRQKAR